MRRLGGKPSPAMIVACLALVFAIAGTSIAATQIGKNSVGAKELGKVVLRKASTVIDSQVDNHGDVTATCASGEQLLGGGADFTGSTAEDYADTNYDGPSGTNGWRAGGYVDDSETTDFTLVVTAVCLKK